MTDEDKEDESAIPFPTVNIPRQSRGLYNWSRSKRQWGR